MGSIVCTSLKTAVATSFKQAHSMVRPCFTLVLDQVNTHGHTFVAVLLSVFWWVSKPADSVAAVVYISSQFPDHFFETHTHTGFNDTSSHMSGVTHIHNTAGPSVTVHPRLPSFLEQHSSLYISKSPHPTGLSLPAHVHSSLVQLDMGFHGNPVAKCQSILWALCVESRGHHTHMLPSRFATREPFGAEMLAQLPWLCCWAEK